MHRSLRILWRVLLATVVVAAQTVSSEAWAAPRTWTGATSANWNDANWTGGAFANGDELTFYQAGAGNLSTNLNGNRTADSLAYLGTATSSVSISGNTLTLNGGGAGGITVASGSATHFINSNVALASAAHTWTINNAVPFTVNGVVSGGNNLTVTGPGTLILSNNANSYTGSTTITGGATVGVYGLSNGAANSGIGASTNAAGNLVLNNGTLQHLGTGADSTDRNFTITAGSNGIIDVNQSTLSLTMSGATAATSGTLIKGGAGNLTLSGSNAHTGGTIVREGTLTVGNANALSSGAVIVNGGTLAMGTTTDTVGAVTLLGGNITGTTGGLTSNTGFTVESGTISAVLSGSGALTKNSVGTVTLSGNANTYSGATNLNAGTLSIGNVNQVGGTSTIAFAGGELEYTGGTATLAKTFSLAANTTSYIDVTAAGTSLTLSSAGSGTGNLTKVGAGNLILGASNTYTGITTIDAGTLSLGADNRLANGSSLVVNGGTFAMGAFDDQVTNVTLASGSITGSGGILNASGSWNVQSGSISAIMAGSAALTKTTTGTVNLTADNTYSGAMTVAGGTLALNGAGQLNSVASIAVQSGGTFELNNTANSDNTRVNDAAAVNLTGGTFRYIGFGANTNSTETVGALTISQGASTVDVQTGAATSSSQLTFASLTANAGGTIQFTNDGANGTLGTAGDNPRVIFTGRAAGLIGGFATIETAAAGDQGWDFADYNATTGVLDLATTAGRTTTDVNGVVAGTNWLTAGSTFATSMSGVHSVNTINFNETSSRTLNLGGSVLTNVTGGIIKTGNNTTTISNGTLTAGAGGTNRDLYFHVYDGTINVSATIADVAGGGGNDVGIVKSGSGTLILSGGANTFDGSVYVNAGTLSFSNNNHLGDNNNDLFLNGGTLQATASVTTTGRAMTVSGNSTIDASGAGTNLTFTSDATNLLSGSANSTLNKTGAGTLTLGGNGTNTFFGQFNALAGTTVLGNTSGTTNTNLRGDLFVASGATVRNAANGQLANDITAVISGTYDIATFLEEAGQWHLQGGTISGTGAAGTGTGEMWVGTRGIKATGDNMGTIAATVDLSLGSNQTAVFDVDNGAASTDLRVTSQVVDYSAIDPVNAPPGNVVKTGSGVLEFANAAGNTYTAGTTISQGTLLVSNTSGSGTGTGSVVVERSGILAGTGIVAPTGASSITIQTGGMIAPGSLSSGISQIGTLTLGTSGDTVNTTVNGTYHWNVSGTNLGNSSTTLAGLTAGMSDTGSTHDLISNFGSLTFDNATIKVDDLTGTFNPNNYYSWTIATSTSTATVAGSTNFDLTDFASLSSFGYFSLLTSGNNIYLNYTPVPEPSTYLMGLGLLAGGFFLRRRLKKAAKASQEPTSQDLAA